MSVEIREVKNARDLKIFIYLPEKLYESRYPQWVHPIYMSEKEFFDPKKNTGWHYSEGVLFLAFKDKVPCGRIMGIVNHKVNKFRKENNARFGFFDSIDDQGVASALLGAVEEWGRTKGCDKLVGPLGFTDLDPEGMLVEGQDNRATITTWWHPPYTPKLLETAGYKKEIDWVTYKVDLTRPVPEVYAKIAKRVLERSDYKLLDIKKQKDLKPYIKPVFELINDAYKHLYGFSPLDGPEMDKIAADYLSLLDPRFVKLITLEGKLVAFSIGMPDMTEGIRAARGRLFPFGILKILNSAKRTKQLDMMLGAIKEEHRGKGLDVLMAVDLYEKAQKAGMTISDSHHELETNTVMRGEMEKLGGVIYKRHRIFFKNL
jgi:GNAT superfamily N-acetyltransferase